MEFFASFLLRRSGFPYELLELLTFDETVSLFEDWSHKEYDQFRIDDVEAHERDNQNGEHVFGQEWARRMSKATEIFKQPKFQEAVFLSNPNLARLYPERLKSDAEHWTCKTRYMARSLMMYLQRFCAKNDTHSFFGPIAWGKIDKTATQNITLLQENACLIHSSFFAYWGADMLLDKILQTQEDILYPYLKPAWDPGLREIESQGSFTQLIVPPIYSQETLTITRICLEPLERAIVCHADGHKTITDLWTMLHPQSTFLEFIQRVKELEHRGILQVRPSIPVGTYQPLEYILEWLTSLPVDLPDWENHLCQLIGLTKKFAISTFEQRMEILNQLNTYFEENVGLTSKRGDGQHYADRYLVYEDCLYDLKDFRLGGELVADLHRLTEGVKLWLHFGLLCQREQDRLLQNWLAAHYSHDNEIPLDEYIAKLQGEEEVKQLFASCEKELYDQWFETYSQLDQSSEISPELTQWTDKFFVSLDVALAARSLESINHGEYLLVLAECHTNLLLLFNVNAGYWQPEGLPEEYADWLAHFMPSFNIINLIKSHPDRCFTLGTHPLLDVECVGRTRQSRKIPISDIVLRKSKGKFMLFSRSLNTPLLLHLVPPDELESFFLRPFTFPALFGQPRWMKDPQKKHYRRIQRGRLVFQREHWILDRSDFSDLSPNYGSLENFYALWKRKNELGLPQQVFVKFGQEPKPIFVDFHNYLLLEILQKKVLESQSPFVVTEMLPNGKELWLSDERGHYTAEFRLMAHSS